MSLETAGPTGASAVLGVAPLSPPWQTLDPFPICVHHQEAYPPGNEWVGPAAPPAGRSLGDGFSDRGGWSMYHGERVPGSRRIRTAGSRR